jgi:hypothetical protein
MDQPISLVENTYTQETTIMPPEFFIPLLDIIKKTSVIYNPYPGFCTTNTTLNMYASFTEQHKQFFIETLPMVINQYFQSLYIEDDYIDQCHQLLQNNSELFDTIPETDICFSTLNKIVYFLHNKKERSIKKDKESLKMCRKYLTKIGTFYKTPLINLFLYLLYQRAELYKQTIIGYPPNDRQHLFYKTRETIKNIVAINISLQEMGDNFYPKLKDCHNNKYKKRSISVIDSAMENRFFEMTLTTCYRNIKNADFYLLQIDIYNHLCDNLFSLDLDPENQKELNKNIRKRIKKDSYGIKLFISNGRALNKMITTRLQNNDGPTS